MSVKQSTIVWEFSKAEGTERLVMLALADFCDDEGVCCPGVARIAKKCLISERSVQRIIARLIDSGELERMTGKGLKVTGPRGEGFTNAYRLLIKGRQFDTPLSKGGVIQGNNGVTSKAKGGDKATSPKLPVVTISKEQPSDNPVLFEADANEKIPYFSLFVANSCFLALVGKQGFIEAWEAFVDSRGGLRKLSVAAAKMIIVRLAEHPDQATAALSEAVERGWKTFKWEWLNKKQLGSTVGGVQPIKLYPVKL